MRKLLAVLISTIFLMNLTGCSEAPSRKEYTIATGSKSGAYYSVGEALDKVLKSKYPDVTIKVIETEGSVDNIQMLKEGKVDMALVQSDIAHYAKYGEAMYVGPNNRVSNIQGMATLFPEIVQFIVRRDSFISKLSDLAGKKLAVGGKNSGTRYNVEQILGEEGILNQVTCISIDTKDAINAIEKGEIDGFVFTSAFPNPSIIELAKKVEIDLIAISLDLTQKLVNKHAFYIPATVQPKAYKGQDTEMNALEIGALLVSGPSLSDEDQYILTKALFEKPESLGEYHSRLAHTTRNRLYHQMSIGIGAGAQKAFSENKN